MTPSTSAQITETLAASLISNPDIEASIDALVHGLTESQAHLTEARPANPDLTEDYARLLEQYAAQKGRGAALPYIGSGLGNGALVELADGSVKWDLICGIGVHLFGHSDPDLVRTALRAGLGDTVMQGNLQFNRETIDFTNLLLEEAGKGSDLEHCFLINSGAMANESALKICFQKNAPATRILAFEDGFAGRSTAMAQIGDSAAGRVGIPIQLDVDYIPFFDPDHPEESTNAAVGRLQEFITRYPSDYACFVMELIQGEGGFNLAPPEFFRALMEICREQDVAVWIDEIQTFGRTEEMFYFQQLGLGDLIDVITIGKMSQVCAVLYTKDYNPKPGLLSATFIGSTVALSVGQRILERLRAGDYYGPEGTIAALHTAFPGHAAALVKKHPEWFPPQIPNPYGGVGGMMRLTPFGGIKEKIIAAVRAMFEEGVICFYCGHDPYHIRFLAPVGVMTLHQFNPVFQIVEKAFQKVADNP